MRTDASLPGIVIHDEYQGLITFGVCAGSPSSLAVAADKFALGCILEDSTTGATYQNGGSVGSPVWLASGDEGMPRAYNVIVGFSNADYICDGVADNVQIQAAIDDVNSVGGGSVYIRASNSVYDIAASITIPSNVLLCGAGDATVLKASASLSATANMIVNSDTVGGNTMIIVKDIKMDGNQSNRTPSFGNLTGHCIFLQNVTYSLVTNVSCINAISSGICIGPGSSKNRVVNNTVKTTFGHGILVVGSETGPTYTSDNIVEGNTVEDAGQAGTLGVGVEIAVYAIRNTVSNNFVKNSKEGGVHLFFRSNYNTVTGNVLHGCNQNGISIVDESDYNTVTGNEVTSPLQVGIASLTSYLTYGGKFNTVSNNVVSSAGWNGIRGAWTSCNISNNVLNSCGSLGASTQQHGMYLSASDYIKLADNRVTSSTGRGINLIDSKYAVVSGNHAVSNGNVGIFLDYASVGFWESICNNNSAVSNTGNGIVAVGQVKRSTFTGNNCRSNTQSGIDVRGALDCVISSNVCTNNTFYGIVLRDDASAVACTNNLIVGNRCSTNATGGLVALNNADRNHYVSNYVYNNTSTDFSATGTNNVVAGTTSQQTNCFGVNTSSPNSILHVSGPLATAYSAKTGVYTITASDSIIDCTSGTFTVTLPTAIGITGRQYTIKNSGSGTITVATTSSQTIDGSTTYSISAQYVSITVVSNGANWIII